MTCKFHYCPNCDNDGDPRGSTGIDGDPVDHLIDVDVARVPQWRAETYTFAITQGIFPDQTDALAAARLPDDAAYPWKDVIAGLHVEVARLNELVAYLRDRQRFIETELGRMSNPSSRP